MNESGFELSHFVLSSLRGFQKCHRRRWSVPLIKELCSNRRTGPHPYPRTQPDKPSCIIVDEQTGKIKTQIDEVAKSKRGGHTDRDAQMVTLGEIKAQVDAQLVTPASS